MREMLAEAVERVLAVACTGEVVRVAERGGWPQALWAQLQEIGLPQALAAESTGGIGAMWSDLVPALHVVGRYAVPVPLVETIAANGLMAQHGADLPAGPVTIALLHETDGTLHASNVAFAGVAKWLLGSLPASSGRAARLLLLEIAHAQATGVVSIAGDHRSHLYWRRPIPVFEVESGDWIGAFEVGAAVRVSQIAGAIDRILQLCISYAGERHQFSKPIGKFQAIQQQLSLLAQLAAQGKAASEVAMIPVPCGLDRGRIACAKLVANEGARNAAAIAHAVVGAIGITEEYDLQLYTRRLQTWALDFGSGRYWGRHLGVEALQREKRIWPRLIELSST